MYYKLRKRVLAVFASAGIIFGSLGVFSDENGGTEADNDSVGQSMAFTDVSDTDWFYTYVSFLYENNIVNGLTATDFVPGGTFTVAEASAVITRYLGLEDQATIRKLEMEAYGVNGSDKWFAGYLQLMHEAGIIDVTEYGCSTDGDYISIDNPEMLQMPVKRYEFAAFVVRSFELEGTLIRTGDDGTSNGNEFIIGGEYDESILELYIPYINDYYTIPSEYNYYVLKAYYNGIFNGDDLGNFNPYNNLTRGEMAKVTAVIINKELRTPIQVVSDSEDNSSDTENNAEKYIIPDDAYRIIDDKNYLLPEKMVDILTSEINNCVRLDGENIVYSPLVLPPDGYDIELRHYRITESGFYKELDSLDDNSYINSYETTDTVLIVMCESAGGRNVAACEIAFDSGVAIVADNCIYQP